MKYLCLAYGTEADWKALTSGQQAELLAADEVLRRSGDFVAPLTGDVTTVRSPNRKTQALPQPFQYSAIPLAGFGIIEAESLEQAIELVKDTPCARAGGAVELRPLLVLSAEA